MWLGIAAAVPGIWLVSREPGGSGDLAAGSSTASSPASASGCCSPRWARCPRRRASHRWRSPRPWALVAVALTAAALGGRWVPDHPSQAWGAVAGVLATAAAVAFLLATQTGLLTIASVVTSLYPAVTIALAALVLRERIHAPQALGLALCGLAVGLVAAA